MKHKAVYLTAILVILPAMWALAGEPAVTVYNQGFAVVREIIHLDLQKGVNQVACQDITIHLEPDSVMLRDPSGKRRLQILEQSYRGDPLSQGLLLNANEGQTLDFLVREGDSCVIQQGRIIRSGYVPHSMAMGRYGQQYSHTQMAAGYGEMGEPIVEIDGKIRFGLPGQPLFAPIDESTGLKPTVNWTIEADAAGPFDAELGYVTGGMSWNASYNFVAPAKGDKLDLVAWITVDNQCGRTFENARLKLMAGDVNKLVPETGGYGGAYSGVVVGGSLGMRALVTEKEFDEFHLYTIERPTSLHDRETKQVEFIRAEGVVSECYYVYDGVKLNDEGYQSYSTAQLMQQAEYGSESRTDVWVMRDIQNEKANQLGMPLPAGRTRFYERDEDEQIEFTGENTIDHTPAGETLHLYTGNAFDLVGQRVRTNYRCDYDRQWCDESFAVTLRNHKKDPVEIRVVERLYRGMNWEMREESDPYTKMDSQKIEFRIKVKPNEEKTVSYTVHYTW
ncbi:MAG TPA: hypothetical protein PLO37_09075 [Candidatus Hydrogenedentes bacterium]|nr:hypothetical protein [Candidatus Hydrogenedentota bacterium]HPG66984.1 hypothetical protein [Candidatus Hydrogenedentota bacterium]